MNYQFEQYLRTSTIIHHIWFHSNIVRILYYCLNHRRASYISQYANQEKIKDKKYTKHLKKDMLFCLFKYGALYDEYFLYQFENKNKEYRHSFITENNRYLYWNKLNRRKNKILFDDKWKTYQIFQKYFKRDVVCIRNQNDRGVFREFVLKHPRFILKPLSLSSGKGISMIHINEKDDISTLFQELFKKVPFIIEELIVQSDAMSRLHPQSVNTVRLPTILTGNKKNNYEAHVFCTYLRMGRNQDIVDNTGAGGIRASVDPGTGIVRTNGADDANMKHVNHPDTGIPIKGFQIPRWEEAVNMVKELALVIPAIRYVCWDCALTESGWVLVEANSNGQINHEQVFDLKGKREELDTLCRQI